MRRKARGNHCAGQGANQGGKRKNNRVTEKVTLSKFEVLWTKKRDLSSKNEFYLTATAAVVLLKKIVLYDIINISKYNCV